MTITKERKGELIAKFKRGENDTGSAEVQIAILTSRINQLTGHLQGHKKDFAGPRPVDAREPASQPVGLRQADRSAALSRRDPAARDPQVIGQPSSLSLDSLRS